MKRAITMLAMAAGIAGCTTARDAGVCAAMPFAAIGDSLILPFQGMGRASSSLIALGDEHLDYVRDKYKGRDAVGVAEYTAGVYYVPGWALWPFYVATPTNIFPMTHACAAALESKAKTATNMPARASNAQRKSFEEW